MDISTTQTVTFSPGKIIFQEGDAPDNMYIIVRGNVRILKTKKNGDKLLLAELRSGNSLGEMSLISGLPRSATAIAVNDVQAKKITKSLFQQSVTGVQPWARPWATNGMGSMALRHDGTPYRGINQFMLGLYQQLEGFTSCYWMTYKQAKELGGQVRKGEKSNMSVFFKPIEKKDDNGDVVERFGFWKAFAIFNASQIDGLPAKYYPDPDAVQPEGRNEAIDAWFAALPATITYGGNSAHLNLRTGIVHMPDFEQFKSADGFYSTQAHECVHWQGLQNDEIERAAFGSVNYAKEELVAEMGAAFTMAHLGLASEPRPDHASYIASWLQKLKDDKKFIFQAASKAQARVDQLVDAAERKAEAA